MPLPSVITLIEFAFSPASSLNSKEFLDEYLRVRRYDLVRSMRQAAGAARALTGHTLHLMVSSLDGHRSHLNRDRTAVYSTSGMSKSLFGEELDETGGDGGGIPARQVVARTRYRHRVDFWNPLLQ